MSGFLRVCVHMFIRSDVFHFSLGTTFCRLEHFNRMEKTRNQISSAKRKWRTSINLHYLRVRLRNYYTRGLGDAFREKCFTTVYNLLLLLTFICATFQCTRLTFALLWWDHFHKIHRKSTFNAAWSLLTRKYCAKFGLRRTCLRWICALRQFSPVA